MSLLPSRPDVDTEPDPRVVGVDSEEADEMLSALSSSTTRQLLSALHEEPAAPSELADRADTTLQNTQYHLEKLHDAGLVEVAGTAYSEKGREMDVYAPADEPLVVFAGGQETESTVRTALSRLLGGVGALALGSLVVQQVLGGGLGNLLPSPGGLGGAPAAEATPEAGDGAAAPTSSPTATEAAADTPTPTPAAEATPSPTDAGTPTETPLGTSTETPLVTSTSTPADTATPTATPTEPPSPTPTETPIPTETVTEVTQPPVLDAAAGLPPGLLFFLGGLSALLVLFVLAYAPRGS